MSIKDVIPEGIVSLVPDNLSDRTALSDLRSILVRDATKVDPTFDITGARTETETRPELLAAVPEFSGFEFDPTQRSYVEDLYALYSGGVPTRDVAMGDTAQIPGAVDTLVNVGEGESGATLPGFDVDSPKNTQDGLTQSGTFAGQPTFTMTPGTTVDSVTGDITNPDGTYGGNIVDEFDQTTPLDTREQASVSQYDTAPKDLSEEMSELSLTPPQTNSLNALARVSNTITDFGKKVQDTLGGVFDSANKTIDVFGQKFNVGKTATGFALSSVFGSPAAVIFGLSDQLSGALPQSSQTVADVLEQTYGVDDQGRIQGNPANNVFAGLNAVSMFGDPLATAQKRINNVVDPNKKKQFQAQFNEIVDKTFATTDPPPTDPASLESLKAELKKEGNVEVDMPTEEPIAIDRPSIADITDGGPTSDDDTAMDAREQAGVSQYEGRDEGTDTSAADAAADAAAAQDAARGGYAEGRGGNGGGGGGGGTYVCTASYANGFITQSDFKILKKYGILLRRSDPYLMKAYDWFGPKLANNVKKGKLFNFAKHSTKMWKYNLTKQKNMSFNIKLMSVVHKIITRPILRVVGMIIKLKEKFIK
tara:strand:- start:1336 stop:3111 length:1776 start_codon:yes stop_codon:yes gene_type:complete